MNPSKSINMIFLADCVSRISMECNKSNGALAPESRPGIETYIDADMAIGMHAMMRGVMDKG